MRQTMWTMSWVRILDESFQVNSGVFSFSYNKQWKPFVVNAILMTVLNWTLLKGVNIKRKPVGTIVHWLAATGIGAWYGVRL